MKRNSVYWIEKLALQQHPEGGYFKEIYRSDEIISRDSLPVRFDGDRCFSTAIYYLLENKDFSAFHRIKSEEIWHFYEGDCINIYCIDETGKLKIFNLGNNPDNKEELQIIIPRNTWFAAKLNKENSFALLGCTVAPGFDFNDFELGNREFLISQYPQYENIILSLTNFS